MQAASRSRATPAPASGEKTSRRSAAAIGRAQDRHPPMPSRRRRKPFGRRRERRRRCCRPEARGAHRRSRRRTASAASAARTALRVIGVCVPSLLDRRRRRSEERACPCSCLDDHRGGVGVGAVRRIVEHARKTVVHDVSGEGSHDGRDERRAVEATTSWSRGLWPFGFFGRAAPRRPTRNPVSVVASATR